MAFPHFSEGDVVRLKKRRQEDDCRGGWHEEVVCVRYDYSDPEPFTFACSPALLEMVQAADAAQSRKPSAAGLRD